MIRETQRHEQLQILDMLKNVAYTENKQDQNMWHLWNIVWGSGPAHAHDSFSFPSLHHSLAELIQKTKGSQQTSALLSCSLLWCQLQFRYKGCRVAFRPQAPDTRLCYSTGVCLTLREDLRTHSWKQAPGTWAPCSLSTHTGRVGPCGSCWHCKSLHQYRKLLNCSKSACLCGPCKEKIQGDWKSKLDPQSPILLSFANILVRACCGPLPGSHQPCLTKMVPSLKDNAEEPGFPAVSLAGIYPVVREINQG